MRQAIGDFLLRRLQEAGTKHIFGVPSDYNLGFMQQLEDRGEPAWVGNCNELNASHATDWYARINGLGALSVTYGVGALQSTASPVRTVTWTSMKEARPRPNIRKTLKSWPRLRGKKVGTEFTQLRARTQDN